jgi:hypothetical protein
MFKNLAPQVVAAIVAAITSIATLLISSLFKAFYEKHFHLFKLEAEHRYEQRKKIKEILSKNKIQLLNCAESLNHRLWNFSENYKENWHKLDGGFKNISRYYYFSSFVYRMVVFFSWIRKIEREMVYLDTTVSTKEDLDFIKYLRLLPQVFCDLYLFEGFDYDKNYASDHFFKNDFELMADCLIKENEICDFAKFEKSCSKHLPNLKSMCQFLDGISPDENRLRWDRLQVFHICLMAFINAFGYDFQYTSKDKIKRIVSSPRKSRLMNNFMGLLERDKINRQKEIKKIIKAIR